MLLGEHDDAPSNGRWSWAGVRPRRRSCWRSSSAARRTPRCVVRDPARAEETVRVVRGHPRRPEVEVLAIDDVAAGRLDADVLVSTVPASAQVPGLLAAVAGVPLVFDVVYEPWPTPLARAAERAGPDGRERARPARRPGGQPGGGHDRTLRRPRRRDAPGRRGRVGVEDGRVTDLYPATAAVTAAPRPGLGAAGALDDSAGCRSRRPIPSRAPRSRGDPEEPKEAYADIAALPNLALKAAVAGAVSAGLLGLALGLGRGRCSSCCRWCRSRWRWPSSTGGPACCPSAWCGRPWA